jgi:hypothetical protein
MNKVVLPGVKVVGKIELPVAVNKFDKVVVINEPQKKVIELINTFKRPACWGETSDVEIINTSDIGSHKSGTYVTFRQWMNMWMEDCGME